MVIEGSGALPRHAAPC